MKQETSTTSAEYTNLQSVTKKIGTNRMQIELQLQAYFDHRSQGACQSESVKVEASTEARGRESRIQTHHCHGGIHGR